MNDTTIRLFAELKDERSRAEEQLAQIQRGDDAGLVDVSDAADGFRYGSERLESLQKQTEEWLDRIEQDTIDLERVSGCKRP